MNDRSKQRTETDERVAENQAGVSIAPLTRDDNADIDPQTGLPRGMHDNDQSPLDRGQNQDPFRGKSPAERAGKEPSKAQEQMFGSSQEHIARAERE